MSEEKVKWYELTPAQQQAERDKWREERRRQLQLQCNDPLALLPPLISSAQYAVLACVKPRTIIARVREGFGPRPVKRIGNRMFFDRDEILRFCGKLPANEGGE